MNNNILLSLAFGFCILMLSSNVMAGSISRTIDRDIVLPGKDVYVTINIDVDAEEYYMIDEIYPNGWTLIDNGGLGDSEEGHLKSIVVGGAIDISYTYVIRPPEDLSTGNYLFTGTYSMQGINTTAIENESSIKHIAENGEYYPQNNTCVTENQNFRITTYNCKAEDIDGKDITQYVTFEWLGGSPIDTNWIFGYDSNLTNGKLYYWKNQSFLVNDYQLTNGTANITIDDVINIEIVGEPSKELCDYGNEWNNIARNVTTLENGSIQLSKVYCFNQNGQINETAYWVRGTYDKLEANPTTKYQMIWSDITDEVSHAGFNLIENGLNYYYIKQATFQPNQKIQTKWVYTPKNQNSTGKWHIMGWQQGNSIKDAIISDQYIYQDPYWNASWSAYRPIDINTTVSKNKIQVKMNIPYDSDMKNDFSDLRFTNNCSNTSIALNATNESQVNGNHIIVWVDLNNYYTNNQICMWYNNPTANAYWDDNATAYDFHDFNDLTNGNIVGRDGFTDYSGGDGFFEVGFYGAYEGLRSMSADSSVSTRNIELELLEFTEQVVFTWKQKFNGTEYHFQFNPQDFDVNNTRKPVRIISDGSTKGIFTTSEDGDNVKMAELKENTWFSFNLTWHNSTTDTVCVWNSTFTNCSTNPHYLNRIGYIESLLIGINNVGSPNGQTVWDYMFIYNTSYDTTYTIGNEVKEAVPISLGSIFVSPSVDPVESSTIQVESFVNSTGEDFDTGLCYIYYPNGTLKTQNTASENTINASLTELNCTFLMAYYETNGTYNISVTANNTGGQTDQSEITFDYNTLNAFTLNESTLSFGTVPLGNSQTTAFSMENTGNLNLSLQINGTNLTGTSTQIDVSYMKFDDDSDLSDGTNMTLALQAFTSLNILTIKNGYIQITVPLETLPDTYTGTINIRS